MMINNEKWRKSSIEQRSKKMIFDIKWSGSNKIKSIINDCLKASWIMQQIWKMNLMRKWKRQRNANVSKNFHCRINQKNYLINFVFVFVLVFKWAFDALFLHPQFGKWLKLTRVTPPEIHILERAHVIKTSPNRVIFLNYKNKTIF